MENKKIYADIEFRSGRILRGEKTRELVNLIINKFAEEDLSRDEVIEMTVGKGKNHDVQNMPVLRGKFRPWRALRPAGVPGTADRHRE